MTHIRIIRPGEEAPEIGAAVFQLTSLVWPAPPGVTRDLEEAMERWLRRTGTRFVIGDDSHPVLAHANLFDREIVTTQGPLLVGALAAVCVHPDYRGRGWGAAVVRAAFEYLPQMGAGVSLFQTDVPHFYEKIGARCVFNNFFDGTHVDGSRDNPFSHLCEMIYPASFGWPEGDIDIKGPGY